MQADGANFSRCNFFVSYFFFCRISLLCLLLGMGYKIWLSNEQYCLWLVLEIFDAFNSFRETVFRSEINELNTGLPTSIAFQWEKEERKKIPEKNTYKENKRLQHHREQSFKKKIIANMVGSQLLCSSHCENKRRFYNFELISLHDIVVKQINIILS